MNDNGQPTRPRFGPATQAQLRAAAASAKLDAIQAEIAAGLPAVSPEYARRLARAAEVWAQYESRMVFEGQRDPSHADCLYDPKVPSLFIPHANRWLDRARKAMADA